MWRAAMMRTFATLVLAALGAGLANEPGYGQESPEKLATDVANDLINGRLAAVVARFTPALANGLPLPALEKVWSGILQYGGAVQEIAPARRDRVTGAAAAVVVVPVRLERANLDLKVSVAGDKVAGFFITPSEAPAGAWTAPDYVDRGAFTDVAVTIGPLALGGTLSLPKAADKVPAVVLIHGSGPNDRDETLGPNRPFRDIAEGLASRGIAALRYDKRARVHPEQFTGAFTVQEETIDDAIAAAVLLGQRREVDAGRIVLVGHSLGGMLAPRIAAAFLPSPTSGGGRGGGIAAIAVLAAATRPLPTVIVEQMEYIASLDGPAGEATKQHIADIKAAAARAMAAKADDIGPNILGAPPRYWADLNAYDPAAAAAKLSLPVMILQGGRDYQVTGRDLERFKTALAGRPDVTIREFPSLNHLFISGEGKSRPEEYQNAGHVDRAVVETLAEFVSSSQK